MKPAYRIVLLCFFIILIIVGAMLISAGFLFPDRLGSMAPPFKAFGFSLFFMGIGEYLNHPVERHRNQTSLDNETTPVSKQRLRTPCVLGNLFVVLAIICTFIAISLVFFPHNSR